MPVLSSWFWFANEGDMVNKIYNIYNRANRSLHKRHWKSVCILPLKRRRVDTYRGMIRVKRWKIKGKEKVGGGGGGSLPCLFFFSCKTRCPGVFFFIFTFTIVEFHYSRSGRRRRVISHRAWGRKRAKRWIIKTSEDGRGIHDDDKQTKSTGKKVGVHHQSLTSL